jgi:hypothetical protein
MTRSIDQICDEAQAAVYGRRYVRDVADARRRVPVQSADPTNSGYAADGLTFDAHRPGYRTGDQAAIDAREAAYRHYVQNLENAWKSPAQLAADAGAPSRPLGT